MSNYEFKGVSGKGMNALFERLQKMKATVAVGYLEGATEPDGMSVAQNMFDQEFGVIEKRIPPRPVFRKMIQKNKDGWGVLLAASMKKTGAADKGLMITGKAIAEQLSSEIARFDNPPNAPFTIKKKGFNNPLVDSGKAMISPDCEIFDGDSL